MTEMKAGYFTVEKNIVGLSTQEIERMLGFRPGRLTQGARIFVLEREPKRGEFVPAGSTLYPDAKGLNSKELERTAFLPGAWLGERLLKVEPELPHNSAEWYPQAGPSRGEQWKLIQKIPMREVKKLRVGEKYWR
jgi:hypothetical protein